MSNKIPVVQRRPGRPRGSKNVYTPYTPYTPLPHHSRDLAAEFHKPGPGYSEAERANQFKRGNNDYPSVKGPDGKFLKGNPGVPGAGRKKGGNNEAVKAIKEFMVELLDDDHYRSGLVKRIKAGELPQIELFLLTKALGKPKEEVEITTNVPLFALPATFVLKEDEVEAESVRVLEEGDKIRLEGSEDGANKVRE